MKRREFIKTAGTAFGAFSVSQLLPKNVFANNENPHFFVQIIMPGGWDTTLSVDPWLNAQRPDESEIFLQYRHDEILNSGNIYGAPAFAPMMKHAADLCVINGVFTSEVDNGHEGLRDYMARGHVIANIPYLAGSYEDQLLHGTDFGVAHQEIFQTGSVNIRHNSLTSLSQASLEYMLAAQESEGSTPLEKTKNEISQIKPKLKRSLDLIASHLPADYSEHLLIGPHMAAELISGAVLSTKRDLDTHAYHKEIHLPTQTANWKDVADLFDVFKSIEFLPGVSLFSLTTFQITSEFARTPALDAAKGKNHNPWCNSVVLAGKNIKGNMTLGASRLLLRAESFQRESVFVAQAINPHTGQTYNARPEHLDDSMLIISPETIAATIARALNVDWKLFPNVTFKKKYLSIVLNK